MKIAVYDKDTYYLQRVCEIMSDKYGPDMEYIPLEKEGIENALKDGSYSLYIFPGDLNCGVEVKDKSIMYFTEEKDVSEEATNRLFKYCNAMEMNKKINEYCEVCTMYNLDLSGKLHSKVFSFFSLGGGMGASTVAAGAATHFAKMGMKTLYLSLKPFAPTGYFTMDEIGTDMDTLYEDVDEKRGKLNLLIRQIFKNSSGVYVLKSRDDVDSIMNISVNKVEKILKILENAGKFEVIVLDMSVSLKENLSTLLKLSSAINIVLDGSNSFASTIRWKMGKEYFSHLGDDVMDKIKIIYNKFRTMPSGDKDIQDRAIGGIQYIENAKQEEIIEKMVNMKFYEVLLK